MDLFVAARHWSSVDSSFDAWNPADSFAAFWAKLEPDFGAWFAAAAFGFAVVPVVAGRVAAIRDECPGAARQMNWSAEDFAAA